jgi:hypothetical protein
VKLKTADLQQAKFYYLWQHFKKIRANLAKKQIVQDF